MSERADMEVHDLLRRLRLENRAATPEEQQRIARAIHNDHHTTALLMEGNKHPDLFVSSLMLGGYLSPIVIDSDEKVRHLLSTALIRTYEYANTLLSYLIEKKAYFCCWSVISSWVETITALCAIESSPRSRELADQILGRENFSAKERLKACRSHTYDDSLAVLNSDPFIATPLNGSLHMEFFDENIMQSIHQTAHLGAHAVEWANPVAQFEDKTIGFVPGLENSNASYYMQMLTAVLALETRGHIRLLINSGRLAETVPGR